MSREILHRVVVDVDHDVAGLEKSLEEHQKLRPSGYGGRLAPFGFSFRREPAVFHFVATGTSLGAGIMLAEFSTRVRAFAPLALGFSAMFFLLAIYSLMTFLRNAATRLDIIAEGDVVTIHRRGLLRTITDHLAADQIVGVIVAADEQGARSVVIAGPRHTALLDVHRAKLLDPDTLPAWIADGIGLVARRATVRRAKGEPGPDEGDDGRALEAGAADTFAGAAATRATRGSRPLTVCEAGLAGQGLLGLGRGLRTGLAEAARAGVRAEATTVGRAEPAGAIIGALTAERGLEVGALSAETGRRAGCAGRAIGAELRDVAARRLQAGELAAAPEDVAKTRAGNDTAAGPTRSGRAGCAFALAGEPDLHTSGERPEGEQATDDEGEGALARRLHRPGLRRCGREGQLRRTRVACALVTPSLPHGRVSRWLVGAWAAVALCTVRPARADDPADSEGGSTVAAPTPPPPPGTASSAASAALPPTASSAAAAPTPPPSATSASPPPRPPAPLAKPQPEAAAAKRDVLLPDLPPMPRAASRTEEEAAEMVAARRPISPAETAIKKRGVYLTGLPLANFDPNFGIGFGVRGNVFDNGPSTDPLFRYAPYKRRLSITLFATSGGLQFHWLDYDAPFVAGSPYRLRAQAVFEQNIDRRYYGIGERSLGKLAYPGDGRTFGKLDDYEASQRRVLADGTTYARYDRFFFRRPIGFFSVERSLFGGRVRPLAGIAVSHATVRDLAGEVVSAAGDADAISARTRLGEDCGAGAIVGCAGGFYNYLRLGIAYDTRDFEPDPTSGVFLDAEANIGTKALGSRYANAVVLGAARGYFSPLPKLTKLVLAGRVVYQVATAGTPFYALDVLPFTEDPKTGLGGFRTLRGFSQDRFVGPVMAIANAEIRWTFASFNAARQHFGLMLVPFVDFGRVFDRVENTTLAGFQRGQGAGFRIAWNQATIVMLDYGVSREGSALYVNFGHIF